MLGARLPAKLLNLRHVVPQQWLDNTIAPGIAPEDLGRLALTSSCIYGRASGWSVAKDYDATLVSEPHHRMELFCAPPSGASTPPTLSSLHVAREPWACSAAKWWALERRRK